jgi:lysophospholipase L1-like esterase
MKYLALGDSYTIGEKVAFEENFPSQLVQVLQKKAMDVKLHKLIGVTGWTTDELASAIEKENPDRDYDLVTLLIGVNNQYRNRSIEEYRWQFYALLCQAVLFAKGNVKNVVVVSIPDWGLTPFNTEKNPQMVSKEIDDYNAINKELSMRMGCHYVDVTDSTREHAKDEHYLASDLLHYSKFEYAIWADRIGLLW